MSISVTCSCGKNLKVKDELAGKRGKCPACGGKLLIPAAADPQKTDAGTQSKITSTSAPPTVPAAATQAESGVIDRCESCGTSITSLKDLIKDGDRILCKRCFLEQPRKQPSSSALKSIVYGSIALIAVIVGSVVIVMRSRQPEAVPNKQVSIGNSKSQTTHEKSTKVPQSSAKGPNTANNANDHSLAADKDAEWGHSLDKFYEEVDGYRKTAKRFPQSSFDFLAKGGEVPTTWDVMRRYAGPVEWEAVFEGFDNKGKLPGRSHKVKMKGTPGRAPMLHVYPSAGSVQQWQSIAPNSKVRFRGTIEGIAGVALPTKSGKSVVILVVSLKEAVPVK